MKNTAFDEPLDGGFVPSTSSSSMIHIISDVFRRRFPVLIATALACFLLSGVALFLITPKYIATARVKIDPNQSGVIGVDTQRTPDQSLVDTETSVLRSRATALSVVKALDLGADPEFAAPTGTTVTAPALAKDDRDEAVAQRLLANLSVQREKTTYVVAVSYRGNDPRKAARIANAVIMAYMNNSVGTRSGTASTQADFLNKRLKEAGDDLAKTEAVAGQYKAQAGIIGSAGNGGYNATVADQQAASLSSQLATAEATASAAQSNLDVARKQMQQGGLDAVSAVLQSAVVTDLRRQRAEVVRTMGEIQARYGPRHPETIKVVQQLRQLDDQIDQEARRVMGSLASDAASKAAAAGTLRSQMGGLRSQQSATNKTVALAQSAEQQANAKREVYNRLAAEAQQITQLSRNMQTQAQMLEAAIPPAYPAYPNKGMILAFGLLLGLSLGLAVITLQELLMKGLRTSDDVESRLNLPFIGSIPRISQRAFKSAGKHMNPADLLIETPIIPFAESLRAARSVLTLGAKSAKVVALVSALPDEGKTTSVLAMARVMAQSGDRVLLIDCDLRKAGLSQLIEHKPGAGIVEILHGDATFEQVVHQDVVAGLQIVPVAEPIFTAEDLFGSQAMRDLLISIESRYDRILIDTPPLMGVADARTLASLASAVVLLVKWNSTPLSAVKSGLAWLDQDRAPVIGAMLTMVDPRSEAIGALYYSQSYAKYYQTAKA